METFGGKRALAFSASLAALALIPGAAYGRDLKGSLGQLPGLVESPEKGTMVEVIKAMALEYHDGKIVLEVFPFGRSVANVIEGKADFHAPSVRDPDVVPDIPFTWAKESMGVVSFVIYSNANKPLTRKAIEASIAGKAAPLKLECPPGFEIIAKVPAVPSNDLENSLLKLQKGRIDAVIWAQTEVDAVVRSKKMSFVHRELWKEMDGTIEIPKGPKGAELDKILSDLIRKLKSSGKMQKLWVAVHRPFEDWQPAKMGW
jgi:polar amino acid transport system substrate-binding protein